MDDRFGIGLALELVAVREKFLSEGGIVLDDAVVDKRKTLVVREMRMRVRIGRRAVRRPAGMADAQRTGRLLPVVAFFRQFVDAAAGLGQLDLSVGKNGETRRIITSVLQFSQTIQKDRRRFRMPRIANYSAHR